MITGSNKRYAHGHGAGHGPSGPSHLDKGHVTDHSEYRELNFRAIVQFMIALFGTVAFAYISMFGMMKVFQWQHTDNQPALSPVVDTTWNANVKPNVQAAPHVTLTQYQQVQDSILIGDTPQGRISIDEAIQQVAAEGLPYRQGTPATQPAQSVDTVITVAPPAAGDTSGH